MSVGVVEGDVHAGQNALTVAEIEGSMFGQFRITGQRWAVPDVRLLPPPLFTSKIICVGRNYADHAAEHGADVPKEPLLFLKPSTSLIGAYDTIQLPPQSAKVEHEAELAVVIGGSAGVRRLDRAQAAKAIFGYTCANDVTARDLQRSDGQWTRAKGFDYLLPAWSVDRHRRSTRRTWRFVARSTRRSANLAVPRTWSSTPASIVSYVSHMMTLLPGDVILTGTPAGVGPIAHGDVVTVRVEGIGELINPVHTLEV